MGPSRFHCAPEADPPTWKQIENALTVKEGSLQHTPVHVHTSPPLALLAQKQNPLPQKQLQPRPSGYVASLPGICNYCFQPGHTLHYCPSWQAARAAAQGTTLVVKVSSVRPSTLTGS
jgi:hypothetical protein